MHTGNVRRLCVPKGAKPRQNGAHSFYTAQGEEGRPLRKWLASSSEPSIKIRRKTGGTPPSPTQGKQMNSKTKSESTSTLNRSQQKLVIEHYPLVQKVVNSIRGRLPSHADLDELHSAGVGGLVDASLKLKPEKAGSFGAYASMRIRGAIMDELRKLDYMPRSARQDAKRITKTRDALESDLGREASDDEVRGALDLSRKQFTKVLRRTQNIAFVSLNDDSSKDGEVRDLSEIIPDESAATAVEKIEKEEMSKLLRERLLNLPEKQRRIVESYYFESKKLAEIAGEFGVSEARICQIHAQALKTLRAKFRN